VDRLPLLLMIGCSIAFGIFPGHFYHVIRSGVDPLVSRIIQVVPIAAGPPSAVGGQPTAQARSIRPVAGRLLSDASRLTPDASRGKE